jgi:hypothetical protein
VETAKKRFKLSNDEKAEPRAESRMFYIVAADVSRRTFSVVEKLAPTDVGGYAFLNPLWPIRSG